MCYVRPYAQSDQSICLSLEHSMSVKILTEHHLEYLSLTGGCTGSSASTLVKMPHCWNSIMSSYCLFLFLMWDNSIFCKVGMKPFQALRFTETSRKRISQRKSDSSRGLAHSPDRSLHT